MLLRQHRDVGREGAKPGDDAVMGRQVSLGQGRVIIFFGDAEAICVNRKYPLGCLLGNVTDRGDKR